MTVQQYNAYKVIGEAQLGAHQIPALYEGSIKLLYQAKDAIERKDYEARFNHVNKVCNIIGGLRDCLNFDEAGDVAKVLDDYYAMIDFQLLTLQSNDDAELCEQIITSLKQMYGAWSDVASEYNKSKDANQDEEVALSKAAESSLSTQGLEGISVPVSEAMIAAQTVEETAENSALTAQKNTAPSGGASAIYSSQGRMSGGHQKAQSAAAASMGAEEGQVSDSSIAPGASSVEAGMGASDLNV